MSKEINQVIAAALARNDYPDIAWDGLTPNQQNLYEAEAFGVEDALDTAGLLPDVKNLLAEALEHAAHSVAARAAGVSTWIMEEAAAVRAGTQNEPPRRNAAAIAIIASVLEGDWRVQAQYPSSTALEITNALGKLLVPDEEPNQSTTNHPALTKPIMIGRDPRTGDAMERIIGNRLGISGSPGTGKSVQAGLIAAALSEAGVRVSVLVAPDRRSSAYPAGRMKPVKFFDTADDAITMVCGKAIQSGPQTLIIEHFDNNPDAAWVLRSVKDAANVTTILVGNHFEPCVAGELSAHIQLEFGKGRRTGGITQPGRHTSYDVDTWEPRG